MFGIGIVECVLFSNGVRFLNGVLFSNGFEQNGRHFVRISNGPDHSKSNNPLSNHLCI